MSRVASRSGCGDVGLEGRQPSDAPIPPFRDGRTIRVPDLQLIETVSGGNLLCRAGHEPDTEWLLTDATIDVGERL